MWKVLTINEFIYLTSRTKKGISVLIVDDDSILAHCSAFSEKQYLLHRLSIFQWWSITKNWAQPVRCNCVRLSDAGKKWLWTVETGTCSQLVFTLHPLYDRSREEIVIPGLNEGTDFYIQKGGYPKSQFTELPHKIHRAIERRVAADAIEERNEILDAILAASPFGITLVKNRTIQ